MATDAEFTMRLTIHDEAALFHMASKHDDCDDPQDLLHEDGSIDIGACLIMLIDPGHLTGATIHRSDVEITDFDEEGD